MPSVLSKDALAALVIIGYIGLNRYKKRRKRSKWVKQWLLKRDKLSHVNLMVELSVEPGDFLNYLRMNEETYYTLLNLVTPLIQKQDTVMRKAITPHERLSATLRFLATGRSYEDMKFSTAISPQALGRIIPECCKAIIQVLSEKYLKFPNTEQEWIGIADEFEKMWNFPNCIGAVDGKHVVIIPPPHSGSYYYNYKGSFSTVLMAIVNANYEFMLVDIGTNGRVSDGGVFENMKICQELKKGTLHIPKPRVPVGGTEPLPYALVTDEAFSLRVYSMKPFNVRDLNYERRIFNYRLSRARRIVENAFGILAARFRIFRSAINMDIDNVCTVVMACCAIHNFLRKTCSSVYTPPASFSQEDFEEGTITQGLTADEDSAMLHLERGYNRRSGEEAKVVRESFLRYFNGPGKVPWQDSMVKPQ